MTKVSKQKYVLKTLADALDTDVVFVPNCDAHTAVQVWRWLSGLRKEFPKYNDGDNVITGIEEDAWCSPQVYRESYCPPDMTCIIRS